MKRFLLIATALCLFSSSAFAKSEEAKEKANKDDISEILDSMGYPELQVVPHASERLAIEAKNEDGNAAVTHWPIQVAGLATMAVGLAARSNSRSDLTDKEKTDTAMITSVTTAVGLGWVVGAGFLSLQRPYRAGVNTIAKYPGKDDRSTLMRERMAEEALEKPARTMRVLEHVAVITNFSMNIAAGYHANETGRIMAGVGAVLSFMPYIFEDRSIDIYEKQLEYKKKIYTPIKSASVAFDSTHKSFTPLTTLTWLF